MGRGPGWKQQDSDEDGSPVSHLLGEAPRGFLRVSEIDAVGQADVVRTGGNEPPVHPVMTEVALPGHAIEGIKGDGVIRARLDAQPAPRTLLIIQDHDAVFPSGDGLFRAGIHTGGIVTVLTDGDPEHDIQLPLHDPGPVLPHRDEPDAIRRPVFLFAGDLAGSASPAEFLIDDEGVGFHTAPPLSFSGYILHRSVRTWVAPMAGSHDS